MRRNQQVQLPVLGSLVNNRPKPGVEAMAACALFNDGEDVLPEIHSASYSVRGESVQLLVHNVFHSCGKHTSSIEQRKRLAARLPSKNLYVRISRDIAYYISQQRGRKLAHRNKYIQQKKTKILNFIQCCKLPAMTRASAPHPCACAEKQRG
jgi:hypothetical protein